MVIKNKIVVKGIDSIEVKANKIIELIKEAKTLADELASQNISISLERVD